MDPRTTQGLSVELVASRAATATLTTESQRPKGASK